MSSSSNWLDRLWSSKQLSNSSPSPIHLHPPQFRIPPSHSAGSPLQQPSNPFTRITHSLSDLFCLPNPPTPSSSDQTPRKFPRKQPNPMHFIPPTNSSHSPHLHTAASHAAAADPIAPLMTNSGGLNESTVVKLVETFNGPQEEEEDPSLDGFSRTEVTVIDTSFAGWKFENFLFRKDATWKARDKKANKPTVALRKKMIKNKEKKRKSLVTATENFKHKKLKVLYPGSSACNQV